jgi:hypothetical protein
MDARYVGAGSARFAEDAQVARGPRSRLVRRAGHSPMALPYVALLTLLLALACAAPAGAATGGDAERASPANERSVEI